MRLPENRLHMLLFGAKKKLNTYKTMGLATEIMGIIPEGRKAIEKMKKGH